jgi:hypothetical protein
MVNTVSSGTSTIVGSTIANAGTSTAATTTAVGVLASGPTLAINPPVFGASTAASGTPIPFAFNSGQVPIPMGQQPAPLPTQTQYDQEAAESQRLNDQMDRANQARRDALLGNTGSALGTTAITAITSTPNQLAPGQIQQTAEQRTKELAELDEAKVDAQGRTQTPAKDKGKDKGARPKSKSPRRTHSSKDRGARRSRSRSHRRSRSRSHRGHGSDTRRHRRRRGYSRDHSSGLTCTSWLKCRVRAR